MTDRELLMLMAGVMLPYVVRVLELIMALYEEKKE